MTGWLVLLVGILFLLRDLGGWDFWGITAWTAIFVIVGLTMICSSGCSACQGCSCSCEPTKAPRKRK